MRSHKKVMWIIVALYSSLLFLTASAFGQSREILKFDPEDSLEELRAKIEHNGYNFTVDHNWVFDMSPEKKKAFFTRRLPIFPRVPGTEEDVGPLARHIGKQLPSSFDWRNYNGHSYIGPIRDQGDCGSCYAFGAAAAAEGTYNWKKGLYDANCVDFSESYIMWCLGRLPEYNSHFYGCGGADYDYYELEALTKEGIIREEDFPYTITDPGSCTHWSDPATTFTAWHRVSCGDIAAIKTAIITYGVVDAAVWVTSAFEAYSGGIYEDANTTCYSSPCYYTPTNHAISLVGWNDNGGDGYWILRNSWGEDWGENGYMRIKYNAASVHCEATYLIFEEPSKTIGDVLIAVDIDGESGWWDPTSTYKSALRGLGYNVVDTIGAPAGGSIPWPTPFTAKEYDVVAVLTGENFRASPDNITPSDETALKNYLDTGGRVLMVGQDVLYGSHPSWGSASGFFKTHMGIDSVAQDTIYDAVSVDVHGAAGNILEGIDFVAKGADASGPFLANQLYIDTLTPVAGASPLLWATDANPCAISYSNGVFKTVFSTVELGATDSASFQTILNKVMQWFIKAKAMPGIPLLLLE